ncbi:bifunctional dihydroorotate dehydrogenase B NAD binding subunit/NADPH-dependent glutamate synthase [Bacteroidales bacterium OttesenSCG-928-C19]|nr:bifunctional dihydroorotate dehydrogenase B NAD binding subunit/NADPH-dependent glutamate synthase [Bacteroidales bacterium OttesenSCG-928-C19]
MYKIIEKELIAPEIYYMEVEAPWVAKEGKPGQFIIAIFDKKGERIPLTICDLNPEKGTVSIVFQAVGVSTKKMAELNVGDGFSDFVGPLGRESEFIHEPIEELKKKKFLFVAGGVGVAPIYPQVKWMKAHGIDVDVIAGARNKSFVFFEDKLKAVAGNYYITTDDGSCGFHGLVTDKIKELVETEGKHYDEVIAIGPMVMMKFVAQLTKQYNIKTVVSLNSLMVDGTGMCGACRVSIGGKTKFTCVDGPEFDGHLVDYDEAMRRQATEPKHKIATNSPGHACNLTSAVEESHEAELEKSKRQKPREQNPTVRAANFEEVSFGFTEEQALAEARRCLQCKKPLCVTACPVSIKIPQFIKEVAEKNYEKAAQVIAQDSSLPAVCGRVCPQEVQCEGSCILGKKGEPIAIGYLERFVADWSIKNNISLTSKEPAKNKRVAVIGSGPAGLTCAGDLAKKGYEVTIFEALHEPGGVLTYGIPEFRLPKSKIVQNEINTIRKLGVKIETNVIIGKSITIDDLFRKEGFDAVFIGSGAGLPKFMNIPGENLNGVISANEILTRSNLMKAYLEDHDTPVYVGKKAVVVGGGNVAMDAARTAKRLGADVHLVYRRSEAEMPARKEEIHHAKEEGINFHFLTNPTEVIGDEKGWVKAVRCVKMELGEPDASGRRSFSEIPNSAFEIEADSLVMSLGTAPNPLISRTTQGLEIQKWGGLIVNAETGATSREGVFAGGDAVTGAATVIEAMGAGRVAAKAIDEYLQSK